MKLQSEQTPKVITKEVTKEVASDPTTSKGTNIVILSTGSPKKSKKESKKENKEHTKADVATIIIPENSEPDNNSDEKKTTEKQESVKDKKTIDPEIEAKEIAIIESQNQSNEEKTSQIPLPHDTQQEAKNEENASPENDPIGAESHDEEVIKIVN